jgi:cytochrome P450
VTWAEPMQYAQVEAGDWVMLDPYGTNHDPRLWTHPGHFDPELFATWRGGAYDLIPRGIDRAVDGRHRRTRERHGLRRAGQNLPYR